MKFTFRKRALACATLLALAVPTVSHATNGMFPIGFGAKATGMGGAGVAYPQDSMAVAYNPAGMIAVAQGRYDAALELMRPPRSVAHDSALLLGDTNERSDGDLFPMPSISMVMADPDEDYAFGFALIGAGLGTDYAQSNGTFFDPIATGGAFDAYKKVGVFLMQMQMLPSVAFRLNENHSVGISLSIAMQTFKAFGLEAFASPSIPISGDPTSLTNRNYDWSFGYGVRVGWLGTFLENQRLRLGVNYAPKLKMQKFNRYKGLFARQGEFDIPENITAGLGFKLTPKMNVAFDVSRIYWNEVPSIGNPGPVDTIDFNPQCPGVDTPDCKLGGDNGMGFGWRNQTVYKLGFDYKYNSNTTIRAGFNYGKAPIPEDQVLFNMLAPATTEKHLTLGATFVQKDKSEITWLFTHAFENTIEGPTAFRTGGTAAPGKNAAITMSITTIGVAYGARF